MAINERRLWFRDEERRRWIMLLVQAHVARQQLQQRRQSRHLETRCSPLLIELLVHQCLGLRRGTVAAVETSGEREAGNVKVERRMRSRK